MHKNPGCILCSLAKMYYFNSLAIIFQIDDHSIYEEYYAIKLLYQCHIRTILHIGKIGDARLVIGDEIALLRLILL